MPRSLSAPTLLPQLGMRGRGFLSCLGSGPQKEAVNCQLICMRSSYKAKCSETGPHFCTSLLSWTLAWEVGGLLGGVASLGGSCPSCPLPRQSPEELFSARGSWEGQGPGPERRSPPRGQELAAEVGTAGAVSRHVQR